MSITLECTGKRIYFIGNTFSVKDQIKSLGGHWDGDRKAWWIGLTKKAEAESLAGNLAGLSDAPRQESTDDIKVIGKAKYKGRSYYVRWVGRCKDGSYKARLTVLDAKIDFWVKCAEPHEYQVTGEGDVAKIEKMYQEPKTLGSLARFVADQKNPDTRRVQCPECDAWHDADERCRECGGC